MSTGKVGYLDQGSDKLEKPASLTELVANHIATMKALGTVGVWHDWTFFGLAANRPSYGFPNRLYYATDTEELSLDLGTSWKTVAAGGAVNHNLLSATHPDVIAASPVAGDIIYANATPKWTKLAKGTDGQVLKLSGGLPIWAAESGGSNHNLLSAMHTDTVVGSPVQGDLIVANSTPAWTKLAKGSEGYVLKTVGGVPTWSVESGLPSGTSGQTLRHSGTSWVASSLLFNNSTNIIIDAGVSLFDVAAWNQSFTRIGKNINTNTNEFGLNIQVRVTGDTGATADYEKAGLLVQAVTSDPSGATLRDIVGADVRGIIYATTTGRAWGLYAEVSTVAGGDGYLTAAELAVRNLGVDQPSMDTTTSKYGLHLVAMDNPSTAAIYINRTGTAVWHKGLFSKQGALGTGSTDSFIELEDKFVVKPTGLVGIGLTSPSYWLQLSTDSAAKPSTNTWTVVSDERLKKDIMLADLDRCYEIVKTLPLKRFTWKEEVYTVDQVKDRSKLGWISQDVRNFFPKGVDVKPFSLVPIEGRTEEIEDCYSLNADQIYAVMYGAIQKIIEKVEVL